MYKNSMTKRNKLRGNFKRILSLLMTLSMFVSLAPGGTFADYPSDAGSGVIISEVAPAADSGTGGTESGDIDAAGAEAGEDTEGEAAISAESGSDAEAGGDGEAAGDGETGANTNDKDAAEADIDSETGDGEEPDPDNDVSDEAALIDGESDDTLAEGGIADGVEGRIPVYFYIAENVLYTVQYPEVGGVAQYPEDPPLSAYPPGYVSFVGWYAEGAGENEPYDFNTPVTHELKLYAKFSDKYLIKFLDGFGNVLISERVDPTQLIMAPDPDKVADMPLPHNKIFEYWSLNETAPYTEYIFGAAPVSRDTIFYPALADKVYAYFVTYGTEMQPVVLKAGETLAKPAEVPARLNYTFLHWTAAPGGDGPEYDWSKPVNDSITLFASWEGNPDSVFYKVVWWLEAPDFDGVPTPGLATDYIYVTEEDRRGTPGTKVLLSADEAVPPAQSDFETAELLRYSEFQSSAEAVISGFGNTIVNVYMTRRVYTVTFDLMSPERWITLNTNPAVKYYGDSYKLNIKYEMNVTDIWPSSATATFDGPGGFNFHSWLTPDEGINELPEFHWFTRRNVISHNMLPTDERDTGYRLEAFEDDPGEYKVRYWFEAYPGQTGAQRTFNGEKYIVDEQYSQDEVPELQEKVLLGGKYEGRDYSDSEAGDGYDEPGSHEMQNFYYKRNKHDLKFEMGGAAPIAPVRDVMYGQPLAPLKPVDPTRAGYTFKGWYKDGNRTLEFDFGTATMPPDTDLTVFAKWESQDFTITFMDGAEFLGTQGVAEGEPISFNNLWFKGKLYETGLQEPGKGTMIGWQFDALNTGELSPFPVDLGIYRDITLYVHWRTNGFKINYHMGDAAPGSVLPTDPREYSIGNYARILGGSIVPPAGGKTFIGWKADNRGVTYYPGSFVFVEGDMNMYPYFVEDAYLAYIQFHNNYAASPETQTIAVEKNAETVLPDESIFTVTPPDSLFNYWQTAPNGGTRYEKYEKVWIGAPMMPVPYYAVWKTSKATLTFDGNGDKANTLKSVQVAKNTVVYVSDHAPQNLEKEGYRFEGWTYDKDDKATLIAPTLSLSDDMTVFAYWEKLPNVRLRFNANGGANEYDRDVFDAYVPVYSRQTLADHEPTGRDMFFKSGYRFNGWSLTAGGGKILTVDVRESNIEVFAIWIKGNDVKLIFDGNGGRNDLGNNEFEADVPINTRVKLSDYEPTGPNAFWRPGHRFVGWTTTRNDRDTLVDYIRIYEANERVFAFWVEGPDVNLIFDANGGKNKDNETEVKVLVPINSLQDLSVREPKGDKAFTKSGYRFDGWSTTRDDSSTRITTDIRIYESDVRVFALWVPGNKVKLIFDANGGKNKNNKDVYDVARVDIYSKQTLENWEPIGDDAFRLAGYRQEGWSLAPGGARVWTVSIEEDDVTVYARWVKGADVKFIFDGNGGKNSKDKATFEADVEINSTRKLSELEPKNGDMFTKPGYKFICWTWDKDDVTTRVEESVDIDEEDITVYAYWESGEKVWLVFNGNGGKNKLKNEDYAVRVDINSTQVLADVQPTGDLMFKKPGYTFRAWTTVPGDEDAIVTSVRIREDNVTVYALWTKMADVPLTFDGNGGVNRSGGKTFVVYVEVNSTQVLADLEPTDREDVFRLAGHWLAGWTTVADDEDTLAEEIDIGEEGVTVYALWKPGADADLIFDGNGGVNKAGDETVTKKVQINSTQVLADVGPKDDEMFRRAGHNFAGWTLVRNDEDTLAEEVDIERQNVRVYALWKAGPDVKLTFDGNGGVNKNGETKYPVQVLINSTQLLETWAPKGNDMFVFVGHDFLGWTLIKDDEDTLADEVEIFTEDVTVYALWSELRHVKLTYDGNGDAANTRKTIDVLKHDRVVLADKEPKGLAKAGYDFDGWSLEPDDESTKTEILEQVSRDTVVYAFWKKVNRSDTPNIDPIFEGDTYVTGQGVPGAEIEVTWPNDGGLSKTKVDKNGNWAVGVPEGVKLVVDDVVSAVQTESGKLPSIPAYETVGGGDKEGNGKSDTPDINVIVAGDEVITGRGTAGSLIEVKIPGVAEPVTTRVKDNDTWSVDVPEGITLIIGDIVLARQTTGEKEPSDWAQRTVIGDPAKVSDTPNINPIFEGDRVVRGEGVPGATVVVSWPEDAAAPTAVKVDPNGFWTALVPDGLDLVVDDIVSAVQTEPGKLPSVPAHETVGGGEKEGDGKSDTPDIDVIYEGDKIISGVGTAGSDITVRLPGGRTISTKVGADDRWSVDVPDDITLVVGDEVFAIQKTGKKEPSDWAKTTVRARPTMLRSDTPNIDLIKAGDRLVTGQGVPNSKIEVAWPDSDIITTTKVDIKGNWAVTVPSTINLVVDDVVSAVQTEAGKLPSLPAYETVGGGDEEGNGKSDTPDIDVIRAGDAVVKGRGVPESAIAVKLPGVINPVTTKVDEFGGWSINVPAAITLEVGDLVFAQQITGKKLPSDWAQRTVIGDPPLVLSDTPNINPIKEGAKFVTGEGVPGATIEVTWPDDSKTTAKVDENGNWTAPVPPEVDLVEGDIVTAIQTEPGKLPSLPAHETVGGGDVPNEDDKSDTPDIDVIYERDRVVYGFGTADSNITVRFPDNSTATAIVGSNDRWSVNVPANVTLLVGDEVFAVQQTGDKLPSDWAQRTVIARPVPRSDTPNIDPITAGDRAVSGQGVPGAKIVVTWPDGTESPAVTVDQSGNWNAGVPAGMTLAEGEVVKAVQTETGKLPSLPAYQTVGAPVLKSDTPDIDVIRVGDTTVKGLGVPGSVILVKLPNWSRVIETEVRANTLWSIQVPVDLTLEEGDIVYAQQITGTKLPSDWAQRTVIDDTIILYSDTPDIFPIFEGDTIVRGAGVPGSRIEVKWPDGNAITFGEVDKTGYWSVGVPKSITLLEGEIVQARQKEPAKEWSIWAQETVGGGDIGEEKSDTPDIDIIYEGAKVITGAGVKDSKITVRLPDNRTLSAVVGDDDRWSVDVPADVELLKDQIVYAMQTTPGKLPSNWAQRTVIADGRLIYSDTPNINPITEGDRVVTGEGVPDAKIEVTWPDGSKTETKVDPNGNWSAPVPRDVDLVEGDIVIAVQTEPGKEPSEPAQETVGPGDKSTEKSDTPDIDEIYVGDTKVTGHGWPGSEILVRFKGNVFRTTTVEDDGSWSVDVPANVTLVKGDLVYARQTTGEREPSDWAQRTVRERPMLRSDTPNIDRIMSTDKQITGQGVPGADIELTWPNGDKAPVTQVRASGNWTVVVPATITLVAGQVVTAIQTEPGKLPSLPASETVNGLPITKSDTPDINIIYAGDAKVTGRGYGGSLIIVKFPDNTTVQTTVNAFDIWTVDVPARLDLVKGDIVFAQQLTSGKLPSDWAQRTVIDRPEKETSDTPNINPIYVGDKSVTGEGVPGASIVVEWPDGTKSAPVKVSPRGNWVAAVPPTVTLAVGDWVVAVQTEPGKLPSLPAREAVRGGPPEDGESDTPDIDVIYAGDTVITGSGIADSWITVRMPDGRTTKTKVGADDKWSVNILPGVNLVKGDVVEAMQVTGSLKPSEWAKRTVIDRNIPLISDTPNINPIKEGDKTVTGEGVPGATITVTWPDGVTTSPAKVDPNGNWTAKVPAGVELKEGDIVSAVQVEPGKLPSVPAHATVGGGDKENDDGKSDTPNIDVIIEGDRVVNGNGVPDSEIIVRFKGNAIVRTTVTPDKLWTVDVPANVNLIRGDLVFAVQITGTKAPSDEAQRTVIGEPYPVLSDTPNIDPILETDKVVTGQGVPGAVITVTWPDGSKTPNIPVDSDGNWTVDVPDSVTLAEGDIVSATQKEPGKPDSLPAQETVGGDKKGDEKDKSDTPDIDVIYAGDRVVTGRGTPGSEITVKFGTPDTVRTTVKDDGTWSVDVPAGLNLKAGDRVYAQQLTDGKEPSDWAQRTVIDRGVKPKSAKPEINPVTEGDRKVTGKGVPDADIIVTWPDGKTGTTKVDKDGNWTIDVPAGTELRAGDKVKAVQKEPGKDNSDPAEATVNAKPKSAKPEINPVTEGDRKVTGKGIPGAEITVKWPDGTTGTTTVDENGNWKKDVPEGMNLKAGDRIEAVQKEAGKNYSDPAIAIVGKTPSSPPPSPPPPTPSTSPSPTPSTSPTPTPSKSPTPTPSSGPGGSRGGSGGTGPAVVIPEVSIPEAEIPKAFIPEHIQYIKGYPDGTVRPDANITRAETAEIIYRLLQASRIGHNFTNKFPDVPDNAWYTESVTYLSNIDIILGYPDGTFRPNNPITRAEFATMISKFDQLDPRNKNGFTDIAGHWAEGFINSAAAKGWISGYLDHSFKPENNILRVEVVSTINRMLHRMILLTDLPAWAPTYTDLFKDHWGYAAIIEASIGHEYKLKYPESKSFLEIWISKLASTI